MVRSSQGDLVYGEVEGSLVFIPREQAEELAAIRDALAHATTWKAFRKRVPPHRYEELIELLAEHEGDDTPPADNDSFPGYSLPFAADGDYPEWPAQLMLEWMPDDVVNAPFAHVKDSVINGQFLTLDPPYAHEIVAMLVAAGFELRENIDLVRRACGYT